MPEFPRIERPALKMKHAVILWNQVQVTAMPRNPHQFGDHAVRVRDGMHNVATHCEVEATIKGPKFEDALVLERQPRREPCVARARELQMVIDDVERCAERRRRTAG